MIEDGEAAQQIEIAAAHAPVAHGVSVKSGAADAP